MNVSFVILAVLLSVGITSFLSLLYLLFVCLVFDKDFSKSAGVSIAVTSLVLSILFSIQLEKNGENDKILQIEAEQIWKSNHCPVYKAECGSKHKYSCELKAAVVGRNRVGEVFVEAYPIC